MLWCRGKSAALNSATQHVIPPEFGRKWGTECLNTKFPLPTLLCAEYSVKLKKRKKKTENKKRKTKSHVEITFDSFNLNIYFQLRDSSSFIKINPII